MESNIKKLYLFFLFLYFSTWSLCNYIFGVKIEYFIIVTMLIYIYIYSLNFIFNRYKKDKSLYLILFLLFIYYIFIFINGIFFKNNARLSVGINEYIFYSLPFLICLFVLYKDINEKYIEKILLIFLVINFITSLLAFYEYITGSYIMPNNTMTSYTVRACVFNGSYLGLGAFIGQLAMINFYFIFSKNYNSFRYKLLFFCSFIIDIIGIISTNSRGPLVATVFGSIIFITLYYIFIVLRSNKINKKFFGVVIIFLLILVMLFVINYISNYNGEIDNYYVNSTIYRLRSIFDWSNDVSNVQRKSFWTYFLNVFRKNYLYGTGIGSTGSRVGTTSIGPTESGVLKRFVELGVFGGMLFYLIIGTIFTCAFKFLIKSKNNIRIMLILITLLASVFVVFIDDITYQVCEIQQTMFFNWFIYGIIILIIFNGQNFVLTKRE